MYKRRGEGNKYPGALSQAVETKLVGNLGSVHGVLATFISSKSRINLCLSKTHGQILFVGKDQQQRISELILVQHSLQLLTCLADTLSIVGIDHKDDTLGVLEVVAPQRTDLVLSTDIPHGERDVLVLDRLDVESYELVSN